MILITRPFNQSIALKDFFLQHRLDSHIDPLIDIEALAVKWPDPAIYSAIVTTSAQAIRIMGKFYPYLSIPVWCVGKESARVAQELGYKAIINYPENALSLVQNLKKAYNQKKGRLLYISGSIISVDLEREINSKFLKCDRIIAYRSLFSKSFQTATEDLLVRKKIKVVLLYSQKTALTFKACVKGKNYDLTCIAVFCKSQKIFDEVRDLKWRRVLVADTLDLNLIKNFYKQTECKKNDF